MKKTIGIFAHVDAGKTTFSERLLFECGVIRTIGRVDKQNTTLDHDETEKRRGITIFSDVAKFGFGGHEYYLVDTPGHVDFSPQAERALSVIDFAVLLISASEGIQSHTKTLWKLLEKTGKPVFIFINKCDMATAEPSKVMAELNGQFGNCLDFSADCSEELALYSESLLEDYMAHDEDIRYAKQTVELIRNRQIFPCFFGSALTGDGILAFLDSLDRLSETTYDKTAPFLGQVFKIRHTEDGNRVAFLKVLKGVLLVKDKIKMGDQTEKINEIRFYTGRKFSSSACAEAGDICGVCGLDTVTAGSYLGGEGMVSFLLQPTISCALSYNAEKHAEVLSALKCLEDEEPTLSVFWNEVLKELSICTMGMMYLEVLEDELLRRFGLCVTFGTCRIMYRETIMSSVYGCGHYEPLKHYAEVHLRLSPGKRGSGIHFDSQLSTDDLSRNYQNLIRTHVFEKPHIGPLTGSPVTDLVITLTNGQAHEKHTSGGDFRESVYRAIRQGLFQAEVALLEPIYRFEIYVPPHLTGKIMADITRMHGETDPPVQQNQQVFLTGHVPVSEALEYPVRLAAESGGELQISLQPSGYAPCHNTEEVVKAYGYDKERDINNPAGSVFVSHGTVYAVPWDKAEQEMHLPHTRN